LLVHCFSLTQQTVTPGEAATVTLLVEPAECDDSMVGCVQSCTFALHNEALLDVLATTTTTSLKDAHASTVCTFEAKPWHLYAAPQGYAQTCCAVLCRSAEGQWMMGEALLVSPVSILFQHTSLQHSLILQSQASSRQGHVPHTARHGVPLQCSAKHHTSQRSSPLVEGLPRLLDTLPSASRAFDMTTLSPCCCLQVVKKDAQDVDAYFTSGAWYVPRRTTPGMIASVSMADAGLC
jgi:hypothetical protein